MGKTKSIRVRRNPKVHKRKPKKSIGSILLSADRSFFLFLMVLVVFLLFGAKVKLNMRPEWPKYIQLQRMNPDAKLYYSIACNMAQGKGFCDTYRNKQIMPTVGHPLLMSIFMVRRGFSPYGFALFFFLAAYAVLGVSIFTYCRSILFSLGGMAIFSLLLADFRWLAGNTESSIVFAGTVLIFGVCLLFKSGFKVWAGLIGGVFFGFQMLVMPMYMYPAYLSIVLLVLFSVFWGWRYGWTKIPRFATGFLGFFVVGISIITGVKIYSYVSYDDSRLVTGTYGAWALYVGNNIYLQPNERFDYRREYYPADFLQMKSMVGEGYNGIGWQERHKIYMEHVKEYWKKYPARAFQGWWWRFRHFVGMGQSSFSWKKSFHVLHLFFTLLLLILIFLRVGFCLKKPTELFSSAGLVIACMFFVYAMMSALFSYSEFRKVAASFQYLVAADITLLYELFVWYVSKNYSRG